MQYHQQRTAGLRTRASLLLSALLFIVILGLTHREHNNERDDTKAKTVGDVAVESAAEVVKVSDREIKPDADSKVERGIPIYLFDAFNESNQISSMEWDHVASIWGRNTTYNNLVQEASSRHEGPRASFYSMPNVTVLYHIFPKTGSSTLRHACLETQYDSCNMPRKKEGMKWPEGYKKPSRLNELFALCPETRHFCLKNHFLTQQYTVAHETRTFLHLFPFRNYDEWVVSALHQIHFREGEKGCGKELELLKDCQPHKYEMDHNKYAKAGLALFITSLKRKMTNKQDESEWRNHHHVLLYDYVLLDRLMSWLNDNYDVPLLPGTRKLSSSL